MPPDLKAVHDVLAKVVYDCYGKTKFISDAKRVGYLFELYNGLVKRGKIKLSTYFLNLNPNKWLGMII